MHKLSVVLAVRNEEKNLGACLASIKDLAGEIVVVDEYSQDQTVAIAKEYGAKVYQEPHREIFHTTKQKALDYAKGDWILQLDADEVVTPDLAKEIKQVIELSNEKLAQLRAQALKNKLFKRHQKLIEQRDGPIESESNEITAFFIPRVNFFLGRPLRYGGAYPDGVIRLIKRGKAYFPQKSVHEQIVITGKVAWLKNSIEHHDSPTLSRYLTRMNRYTNLQTREFEEKKVSKSLVSLLYYSLVKPFLVFLNLYFRHKGFLDGAEGFLWCFLSATHYPIAYFKYWTLNRYN